MNALATAQRVVFLLVFAALLASLQACGPGSGPDKPKVAARVNEGEISLSRIDLTLGPMSDVDPMIVASTRRSVLDSLVDEELAAQAAEAAGLNRVPEIAQAIQAAQRNVLARAWIEQVGTSLPAPDTEEATRYYADHPELFARRRIYNLRQFIVFEPDSGLMQALQKKIDAHAPMAQIGRLLEERQADYSVSNTELPAEQIPMDVLVRLDAANDGQTLLVAQRKSTLIIHLASSTLRPVSETDAMPRILKLRANESWTNVVGFEIKRLKRNASITYAGEFAPPSAVQPIPVKAVGGDKFADARLIASFDKSGVQP